MHFTEQPLGMVILSLDFQAETLNCSHEWILLSQLIFTFELLIRKVKSYFHSILEIIVNLVPFFQEKLIELNSRVSAHGCYIICFE